jgi:holo-[acyl-carrier protein] synthase
MRVLCGTDIIDVRRVEKTINSNAGFTKKVFTNGEINYCESRKAGRYESYAARFAAKEAFLKALGIGLYAGAALLEIEIVNDAATGAPSLNLCGGAAEIYGRTGCVDISVSLTHTAETALATVVVLCE